MIRENLSGILKMREKFIQELEEVRNNFKEMLKEAKNIFLR